jgi:adenosylcobinamide kinase/adenosylcobinamide-phosphate guanylyltransferase
VRRAPFHVLVDGKLELSAAGPRLGLGLGGYQVRKLTGGWDVTGPDGARLLAGARPEVAAGTGRYDAVLLDLGRDPVQLGRLRARDAVDADTLVLAGFVGHQVWSERELDRRCRMWRAVVPRDGDTFSVPVPVQAPAAVAMAGTGPAERPWRVLVLGGSGSGKSAEAELRLAAEPAVTYLATGPAPGPEDPEWAARVAAHRERRPSWWTTVEITAADGLARELTDPPGRSGAVLVDSVTTWLAAAMDECGAWDGGAAAETSRARLAGLIDGFVAAWRQTRGYVVAVSDETGLGVVPETRAGRRFRDELGRLNQRLAADANDFTVIVAGRPLMTAD